MDKNYNFEKQDPLTSSLQALLFKGLNENTYKIKKFPPMKAFGFAAKDTKERIIGGITGLVYYSCLYIDMLWVEELHQKQGVGTTLVHMAENFGKQALCIFSTVNTMDWEALPFYQTLGYTIEFVREAYQGGSKLFLLRKAL